MTVHFDWNGDKILDKFRNGKAKYEKKTAENIATTARFLAPEKTGALRGSIRAKKSKHKNGGYLVLVGDSKTDVKIGGRVVSNYASLVELGTPKSGISSRQTQNMGFTRRAMNKHWKAFKSDLEEFAKGISK